MRKWTIKHCGTTLVSSSVAISALLAILLHHPGVDAFAQGSDVFAEIANVRKAIDYKKLQGTDAFSCRTEGLRVVHGGLPLVDATGAVLGSPAGVDDVTEKLREALSMQINEMIIGQDKELMAAIESRAGQFQEELARFDLSAELLPKRFVGLVSAYPQTMKCSEGVPQQVTMASGTLAPR